MKRFLCYFLLFLSIGLTACSKKEAIPEDELYHPEYDDTRSMIKEVAYRDSVFYIVNPFLVQCIDFKTHTVYPLCSKADCTHTTRKCNAFSDASFVCLGKDALYYVESGAVYEKRLDGTGTEKIGEFYQLNPESSQGLFATLNSPIQHRGFLYQGLNYSGQGKQIRELARIPVTGGKKEILYYEEYPLEETEQMELLPGHIYGIGTKVYFQLYDYYLQTKTSSSKLYVYDLLTDQVTLLKEGEFESYYCAEGIIYFAKPDGIYAWDGKTEETCIFSFQGRDMKYTLVHFYPEGFILDNSGELNAILIEKETKQKEVPEIKLDVYQFDGTYCGTIPAPISQLDQNLSEFNYIYGFGGIYEDTLIYHIDTKTTSIYAAADFNQLLTGSSDWYFYQIEKNTRISD